MDNYQIADTFSLLARIMDIHGENSFKTRSYSSAAFQIEKLPRQLADMTPEEIAGQKGIGAAISQKIGELLQTGKLPLLEKYITQTPPGVIEMLNIKGLGPKKIHTIWKEMGIESIGELQYACHENRLTLYKGFGEKTQQNVYEAIQFYLNQQGLFLYQQVEELAGQLLQTLQAALPSARFAWAGAFLRQDEIIDTLCLLTTAEAMSVSQLANAWPFAQRKEAAGDDTLLYDLDSGPQLEIQCTDAAHWGHALFLHTGTEDFTKSLLAQLPGGTAFEQEEDIFRQLQLPVIPPCLRSSADVVKQIKQNGLPALIAEQDIRGIIHTHSTWSDGSDSIEDMARAAMAQGLEYLVISDHSRSATYANGLQTDRILQQHAAIDALNRQLAPFRIFKSIECDILGDGQLDYPDEILALFDLVIASVHSNLKMTEEKAMHRLLQAIRNPYVTILGHMTGRLLLSRNGYPVDHRAIIDACVENHVAIELNAHPRRLDIDWRWIPYVTEKGGLISINPDAHAVSGYADVRYGVLVAQKGMLTKEKNLSSFPLPQLEAYLQQVRKARGLDR
ncbi:MAG: helix-hairpin-helix domain-containing protein [Chitinophagaceae bacterium]|nr:helix-hairpin-helix domain-containing protein [Chitinophagaceae bacterium]